MLYALFWMILSWFVLRRMSFTELKTMVKASISHLIKFIYFDQGKTEKGNFSEYEKRNIVCRFLLDSISEDSSSNSLDSDLFCLRWEHWFDLIYYCNLCIHLSYENVVRRRCWWYGINIFVEMGGVNILQYSLASFFLFNCYDFNQSNDCLLVIKSFFLVL